jgi:DNA recombination protein RmuC
VESGIVVLVVLAVSVGIVALLMAFRSSTTALQQQLVELRSRLETLATQQSELPRLLAEGDASRARSLADVRESLVRLTEATTRLEAVGGAVQDVRELLRVPKLRGTIGEIWLEELLRQVFPVGTYEMQYAFRGGERVDAVVHVGDRLLPIDAKFPLEACQRMLAASDADVPRERRAFQRGLRDRIDEIAQRYLRPGEGTFDFALMYIPAENVYYEAVIRDAAPDSQDSVIGYALKRHVIPVSPNTLYAYLSAILHGLRGLEVERRAREILDALAALEQQLLAFGRSYELVGRHLDHAVRQYEESDRQWTRVRERATTIAQPGTAAPLAPPTDGSA